MVDYYEVDKLVALHVMKWKPVYYDDNVIVAWDIGKGRELFFTSPFESDNEWSPSTNISDAWMVVERIGHEFLVRKRKNGEDFRAFIIETGGKEDYAHAKTAPLAICLAALKTVGVDADDI